MIDRLRPYYERVRDWWAEFQESRLGQRLLTGLRWLFVGAVSVYLAYQLTTIGWGNVWASLPTTPWFYVLLLLMYGTLPLTEAVLYGTAWNARYRDLLPVLFRKRVLNNDVLGYSGEAYFYLWTRRETNLGQGDALRTIKDNTIISSATSTSVAFLLLGLFFFTGQIELLRQYLPNETYTIAAGVAVVICALVLGITFRRSIFSLPTSLLWLLGAGHFVRFVLNNGFQVTQWAVVIPEVPLGTWITLLALYIVINQMPFVPARSLFFMSASVELAGPLDIPTAPVASMLLAQTLLDRLLNFLVYTGTTAVEAVGEDVEDLEELSLPEEVR